MVIDFQAHIFPQEYLDEELRGAYDRMLREDGPFVVSVKVATGRAEGRLDRDVVGHARRFKGALAELPAR